MKACQNMGFKISPYLAVEAHLISCGGFATQGKGPFDVHRAIAWLKKRSLVVAPSKPDIAAEIVKRERSNLNQSNDFSMLLPKVATSQNRKAARGGRNAAIMRSLDVPRKP